MKGRLQSLLLSPKHLSIKQCLHGSVLPYQTLELEIQGATGRAERMGGSHSPQLLSSLWLQLSSSSCPAPSCSGPFLGALPTPPPGWAFQAAFPMSSSGGTGSGSGCPDPKSVGAVKDWAGGGKAAAWSALGPRDRKKNIQASSPQADTMSLSIWAENLSVEHPVWGHLRGPGNSVKGAGREGARLRGCQGHPTQGRGSPRPQWGWACSPAWHLLGAACGSQHTCRAPQGGRCPCRLQLGKGVGGQVG